MPGAVTPTEHSRLPMLVEPAMADAFHHFAVHFFFQFFQICITCLVWLKASVCPTHFDNFLHDRLVGRAVRASVGTLPVEVVVQAGQSTVNFIGGHAHPMDATFRAFISGAVTRPRTAPASSVKVV